MVSLSLLHPPPSDFRYQKKQSIQIILLGVKTENENSNHWRKTPAIFLFEISQAESFKRFWRGFEEV